MEFFSYPQFRNKLGNFARTNFSREEELNFCISQQLEKLLILNLQRAKDIIVETIGEIVWHNVKFQCVKNLENVVR